MQARRTAERGAARYLLAWYERRLHASYYVVVSTSHLLGSRTRYRYNTAPEKNEAHCIALHCIALQPAAAGPCPSSETTRGTDTQQQDAVQSRSIQALALASKNPEIDK